ncbi:MAG: hypothetical protein ACRCZP_09860 [Phycicoccus sp.]
MQPLPLGGIGPDDFLPYATQVVMCECPTCRATGPASSAVLLRMLRDGTHIWWSLSDRAAYAREVRADQLTHLRAIGASGRHIAAVEQGYVRAGAL